MSSQFPSAGQHPSSVPGARPPQKSSGTKTVLIIVGVLAGLGVLLGATCFVSILVPGLSKARQAAQRIKSESQLRNIAQALSIHAMNHGDQFPRADEDWQQLLIDEGTVTRELLTAPQAEPGQVSYFYVPGGTADFESDRVLVYENPALYDNRGGSVAFEDGRTVWLEGDEFWAVVDNITLEDGTVFRPHRQQP